MSKTQVVTDLPVKPSTLKMLAKRTAIASAVVVTAAAIYLKVKSNDSEPETTASAA